MENAWLEWDATEVSYHFQTFGWEMQFINTCPEQEEA